LSNPAKKDLNMNGYDINNIGNIQVNTLNVNNLDVVNLTAVNTVTNNLTSVNIVTNSLDTNNLYSDQGAVINDVLRITGASLILDNSQGGVFQFFAPSQSGGGLQAGDLQLFHYTNGVPDNQPLIVTSTGNLVMPTNGTSFSTPKFLTNTLSVVGGRCGTVVLNGAGSFFVVKPDVTLASTVFLTCRDALLNPTPYYNVIPNAGIDIIYAGGSAGAGALISYMIVESG